MGSGLFSAQPGGWLGTRDGEAGQHRRKIERPDVDGHSQPPEAVGKQRGPLAERIPLEDQEGEAKLPPVSPPQSSSGRAHPTCLVQEACRLVRSEGKRADRRVEAHVSRVKGRGGDDSRALKSLLHESFPIQRQRHRPADPGIGKKGVRSFQPM